MSGEVLLVPLIVPESVITDDAAKTVWDVVDSRRRRYGQGTRPRLERTSNGQALVRAFTDLKRHSMGEMLAEQLEQGGVPGGVFLTKKLWGFASEPHFLHHCRATLISDAILAHGGEAQAARDAFAALRESEWVTSSSSSSPW